MSLRYGNKEAILQILYSRLCLSCVFCLRWSEQLVWCLEYIRFDSGPSKVNEILLTLLCWCKIIVLIWKCDTRSTSYQLLFTFGVTAVYVCCVGPFSSSSRSLDSPVTECQAYLSMMITWCKIRKWHYRSSYFKLRHDLPLNLTN